MKQDSKGHTSVLVASMYRGVNGRNVNVWQWRVLTPSPGLCATKVRKFCYSTVSAGCTSAECLLYNVFSVNVIHYTNPARVFPYRKLQLLHLRIMRSYTRVEAGSYTSTVILRGFPPLRSGVRDRVCHVGFCGGQSGAGVGFLRVLRFPCQFSFHQLLQKSSSSIIRVKHNRPLWVKVQGL
jgi:hypothetical protein